MQQIYSFLIHLQQVKNLARHHGASVDFDVQTFELVLHRAHHVLHLLPRFLHRLQGGETAYTHVPPEKGGFAGWLPYRIKRWEIGAGKLPFKRYCLQSGLRTPLFWAPHEEPTTDYLVKPVNGSFGKGILGPFRVTESAEARVARESYKEQFVQGTACKIWYWNSEPVACIMVPPPMLYADGRRSIRDILQTLRGSFDATHSLETSEQMLRWQGYSGDSVPTAGSQVQMDFLYGHAYERISMEDPDCLQRLSPRIKSELQHIGRVLHAGIPVEQRTGCLYTVDGVLDRDENLWLLEMNCHTVVHPRTYPLLIGHWVASLPPLQPMRPAAGMA